VDCVILISSTHRGASSALHPLSLKCCSVSVPFMANIERRDADLGGLTVHEDCRF